MKKKLKEIYWKYFEPWDETLNKHGFGLSLILFTIGWPLFIFFVISCFNAKADMFDGSTTINQFFDGNRPIDRIFDGATQIYQAPIAGPPITNFSVAPSSIDLDTRPTGTLTFTFAITGKAGNDLTAQIVRLPDGANIGTTFSGINGANISTSLPNIPQPTSTTGYRIISHYSGGGSSHRDIDVDVTKNAGVSACSFRSVPGGQEAPLGQTLHITCTITGYPRPVVTIAGWVGSPFTDRHFTSSGTNQWSFTASQFFGSVARRVIPVVATNSSNSVTFNATYQP